MIWQIAAQRSTYKKLDKRSALYEAIRKIENAKAQVRARSSIRYGDQAAVWLYQGALLSTGEEHRATGEAVRAVKPVDGAPTFTGEYRSGAPVMWEMAARGACGG